MNSNEEAAFGRPFLACAYKAYVPHESMAKDGPVAFPGALESLAKLLGDCNKRQGTTLQSAEKLIRAVGRGFIPGIKTMESAVALATEVCFCGESPEIRPFPQPLQSCRKPNKKRPGFSPRGMLFGPFVQNQPFSAACLSRSEGIEHRLPVIRRLSEIEHRKSENGHFRLLPSTIVDAK